MYVNCEMKTFGLKCDKIIYECNQPYGDIVVQTEMHIVCICCCGG